MEKNLLIKGEALQASVVSALAAEQFLNEHYQFRRNQLNGKVEFSTKSPDGQASDYSPLTQEALFRKPEEGEHVKSMNTSELLGVIQDKYPTVPDTMSTRVRLGQAMKLLEYDSTSRGHTSYYKAVPLKAA